MNTLELRILQLLTNNGDRMKQRELSAQMSRHKAADRNQALSNLEQLDLISSAKVPHKGPPGGVPGVVYWLTPAGLGFVRELKNQRRLRTKKRGAR